MTAIATTERQRVVRRGQWLTAATLLYNSLEAGLSIGVGVFAGSVALVGFGADSVIELTAGLAALWRLRADVEPLARARTERQTVRLIGLCFLALAVYVASDSARALMGRRAPAKSVIGIVVAAASLVVMPLLARSKRRVAVRLASAAIAAEAQQTQVCAYLSAILLVGLACNATVGWWWADPTAALIMVPLIVREGVDALRGRNRCCGDCAPQDGPLSQSALRGAAQVTRRSRPFSL
jgi:divalent metal cation (Fe/Co/Zn/Cd) transporter